MASNLTTKVLAHTGLDQGALAEKLGVRREAVNTWARGRFQPTANSQTKLKAMLGSKPANAAQKPKRKR